MNICFNNIIELYEELPDEKSAHRYIAGIRWKHGVQCPHCSSSRKIHTFGDGKRYKCADCRKQFTVRIGTIFQDSPISLRKWIAGIWLATSNRKGIASTQLMREIGITQKSAWHMLHRIRRAMGASDSNVRLSGIVEVDETYVGGKQKNKHKNKKAKGTQGRSLKDKEPIIGMRERGGKVVAKHVSNTSNKTVIANVVGKVESGSVISTDEYRPYEKLSKLYQHVKVNHSVGEYVKGMASTNGIESFWSLLKRGYVGIYHHMSAKHLGRYVDEYSSRFNLPDDETEGFRCTKVLENIHCGKLSWDELTA